jgi:hypothetical protein
MFVLMHFKVAAELTLDYTAGSLANFPYHSAATISRQDCLKLRQCLRLSAGTRSRGQAIQLSCGNGLCWILVWHIPCRMVDRALPSAARDGWFVSDLGVDGYNSDSGAFLPKCAGCAILPWSLRSSGDSWPYSDDWLLLHQK